MARVAGVEDLQNVRAGLQRASGEREAGCCSGNGTGAPNRFPSRTSCTVPPGVGVDGATEAATVTAVPCTTVDGVTTMVVVVASAVTPTVKAARSELDW